MIRRLACLPALLLAIAGSSIAGPVSEPLEVVKSLTRAFNAHDVDAMARFVSDDVQWLSLHGATVSIEADGKEALITGMKGYFAALPSARSEIEQSMVSGRYLIVRERALWTTKDGEPGSQSALAVYEIADGLVQRVWYYPAEE